MESSYDNYRVEEKNKGFYLIINDRASELMRARQDLAKARINATKNGNLYYQLLGLFKRGSEKETL